MTPRWNSKIHSPTVATSIPYDRPRPLSPLSQPFISTCNQHLIPKSTSIVRSLSVRSYLSTFRKDRTSPTPPPLPLSFSSFRNLLQLFNHSFQTHIKTLRFLSSPSIYRPYLSQTRWANEYRTQTPSFGCHNLFRSCSCLYSRNSWNRSQFSLHMYFPHPFRLHISRDLRIKAHHSLF